MMSRIIRARIPIIEYVITVSSEYGTMDIRMKEGKAIQEQYSGRYEK